MIGFNKLNLRKIYKILKMVIALIFGVSCILFLINAGQKRVYPLKYKEEIILEAKETAIDSAVIFAIIKIESGFNPTAISEKGAKGLMQLTDSTAKYVAELNGIYSYDIFSARDNIKLGCRYLKYLLIKFKNIETAVCAYNAGEGNVSVWLTDERYSKDGKTLFNIPFKETATHQKKFQKTFLKYNKLYQNILDKSR